MSFRFLTYEQLQRLQEPDWLIDGVLPVGLGGSFGVLFGKPGSGKSFVALDMAHCVASGQDWHGRHTRQGDVVYLAAEGALGFKKRAAAWAKSRGHQRLPRIRYVIDPINLMDMEDVELFLRSLRESGITKPSLIIIDTLARSMPGGDENEAKDIGMVIRGIGRIQTLGCIVLIIHHEGWGEESRIRGSSALKGATDFMLRTSCVGETGFRLECNRMKDGDEFPPMTFDKKAYAGSLVLMPKSNLLRLTRKPTNP